MLASRLFKPNFNTKSCNWGNWRNYSTEIKSLNTKSSFADPYRVFSLPLEISAKLNAFHKSTDIDTLRNNLLINNTNNNITLTVNPGINHFDQYKIIRASITKSKNKQEKETTNNKSCDLVDIRENIETILVPVSVLARFKNPPTSEKKAEIVVNVEVNDNSITMSLCENKELGNIKIFDACICQKDDSEVTKKSSTGIILLVLILIFIIIEYLKYDSQYY